MTVVWQHTMTIELPIITVAFCLNFLFYVVATVLFAIGNKWYYKNMKSLNPKLYHDNQSYSDGLATLIEATVFLGLASAGLLFFVCQFWPVCLAFALMAREVYRGAIYYVKIGEHGESVKHLIVHGTGCGYLLGWFMFTVLPRWLPSWLLAFIF